MPEVPKICAFRSTTSPASQRWLAVYYVAKQTPKGKRLERLPMIFPGSTRASVVASARKWWIAETERLASRGPKYAAAIEKRRATIAAREAANAADR